MRLKLLFLLFLSSYFSPLQAAPFKLDFRELTAADRPQYVSCKKNNFFGTACKPIFEKVCSYSVNKDNWDCLGAEFKKCAKSDFTALGCQAVLKNVCEADDEYDTACETYRYEQCSTGGFVTPQCKKIREAFEVGVLAIEAEERRKSLPEFDDNREQQRFHALYQNYKCDLVGDDQSNPIWNGCGPLAANTIDWESFSKIYKKFGSNSSIPDPIGNTPDRPFTRIDLYKALLASPSTGSQFDQLFAEDQWFYEFNRISRKRDGENVEVLRLAAEAFQLYADDSLHTVYALIEMTEDLDPIIQRLGIRGLSTRKYDSGLAMTSLLKAVKSDDLEKRTYAMKGVAVRFATQLQSPVNDPLAAKKLQGLMNCLSTAPNPGLYAAVVTLSDVNLIDLKRNLCSIGLGARLSKVKKEILGLYYEAALSGNDRLKEVAIEGLGIMSTDLAEQKRALEIIMTSLRSMTDPKILSAGTSAILSLADVSDQVEQVTPILKEVIRIFLRNYLTHLPATLKNKADADPESLKSVESLLLDLKMNNLLVSDNTTKDIRVILQTECLDNEQPDFPRSLKLVCFQFSAQDDRAVQSARKVVHEILATPSSTHRLKMATSQVIASGSFSFVKDDNSYDCDLFRWLASELQQQIFVTFKTSNVKDYPSLNSFTAIYYQEFILGSGPIHTACPLVESHAAFKLKLKSENIFETISNNLESSIPRLPVDEWLKQYQENNPQSSLVEIEQEQMGDFLVRRYKLREVYQNAIKDKFSSTENARLLFRMELLDSYKEAASYLIYEKREVNEQDLYQEYWKARSFYPDRDLFIDPT